MPLFSLTYEKIEDLTKKFEDKEQELAKVKVTTEIEQWTLELDDFIDAYNKWIEVHSIKDNIVVKPKAKAKKV
jgi:hypothetical protein